MLATGDRLMYCLNTAARGRITATVYSCCSVSLKGVFVALRLQHGAETSDQQSDPPPTPHRAPWKKLKARDLQVPIPVSISGLWGALACMRFTEKPLIRKAQQPTFQDLMLIKFSPIATKEGAHTHTHMHTWYIPTYITCLYRPVQRYIFCRYAFMHACMHGMRRCMYRSMHACIHTYNNNTTKSV